MKQRHIFVLLSSVALLLAFVFPTYSQSRGGTISVVNADAFVTQNTAPSAELLAVASSVDARYVINSAQAVTFDALASPTNLLPLLQAVSPRIAFQRAQANWLTDLAEPTDLLPTLAGLSPRYVANHAQSNRLESLRYPIDLVNDVTPPFIISTTAMVDSSDAVTITWTTDEFANSLVEYGTQSGVYTFSANDGSNVKDHMVRLPGFGSGRATYFYRVTSTDLSGNIARSGELTFANNSVPTAVAIATQDSEALNYRLPAVLLFLVMACLFALSFYHWRRSS